MQVQPEAINSFTEIMQGRGDAMLILAIIMAILALWVWKVTIPERKIHREEEVKARDSQRATEKSQQEILIKQAETLAALGQVTSQIHGTSVATKEGMNVLLNLVDLQILCLGKIVVKPDCDIRDEVNQMRGILKLAKADPELKDSGMFKRKFGGEG